MTTLSVTEMPNAITTDIDLADARGILGMLSQTDAQIFEGYEDFSGLKSPQFFNSLRQAHDILVSKLEDARMNGKRVKVVLSGAGTSGRLAMFLSQAFNPVFEKVMGYAPLDFLIAGGIAALIKAQEGAEDDPIRAMEDLDDITEECDGFILIGITCGLSAHYISGQLYQTINQKNQPALLIGFNPLYSARTIVPENWEFRFADIVGQVQDNTEMVFLNPVVGPEAIAGSTRMKGGTTTKIIVESLFGLSLHTLGQRLNSPVVDVFGIDVTDSFEDRFTRIIGSYETVKDSVYARNDGLIPIMEHAGQSLNAHWHVYYLGEGMAGSLGIIDASECPPTFGADFSDVRGFINGGWSAFCSDREDLAYRGAPFDIGLDDFTERLLPDLTEADVVIITGTAAFHEKVNTSLGSMIHATVFRVLIPAGRDRTRKYNLVLNDFEDWDGLPVWTSTALKMIYNAITTAAHIFKGKIFENKMIDLRISNNKLFHRCIGILKTLAAVDASMAEEALLKSIYRTDDVSAAIQASPVSKHIQAATDRERVVPIALVLAGRQISYEEARQHVVEEHIVRNIIKDLNVK